MCQAGHHPDATDELEAGLQHERIPVDGEWSETQGISVADGRSETIRSATEILL